MADYGNRVDGTRKGNGFFGAIPAHDGMVSTEISVGVDFGQGEEQIPTMVPTLNGKELKHLLEGKPPTKEIVDKAINFAIGRKKNGLPVFALPEEEGSFKVPKD